MPHIGEVDAQIHRARHGIIIGYRSAVHAAEGEIIANLQLVQACFRIHIETRSGCQSPSERRGDSAALVFDAITDLRTEIQEPTAYRATEVNIHQYRQLDIMQVIGRSALFPATVLIVQFHLEMAELMSGVAEDEAAVTA